MKDSLLHAHGTTRAGAEQDRARLSGMLAAAPVGIFQTDLDGSCVWSNSKLSELIGLSAEQCLGLGWLTGLHPEDAPAVAEQWQAYALGERDYSMTHRFLRPDGSVTWVQGSAQVLRNEHGDAVGHFGFVADITEQRVEREQAEAASRQVDEFFDMSLDLLAIIGPDRRFHRLNPRWAELLGHPLSELLSGSYLDFVHPDDVELTLAASDRGEAGSTDAAFRNRYRCADGSYRLLEWTSARQPHRGQVYSVARDVTESQRSADAVGLLAALVQSTDAAVVGWGSDGRITSWNAAAAATYGRSAEQMIGQAALPVVPAAPGQGALELMAAVARGERVEPYETHEVGDDRARVVTVSVSSIRSPTGDVVGGSLIARDVTEEKRQEQVLQAQQQDLRATIATASDPFLSLDETGRVREWNTAAETAFGWSRAEAIGRTSEDLLVHSDSRASYRATVQAVLASGDASALDGAEVTGVRRDGQQVPLELAAWPVRLHDRTYVNCFLRDVTERRQTQAALTEARDRALEASRLKSQFLATMSHEIRTPMNGVIGLTSLLLASPLDESQRRHAEGIRGAGAALLTLINDLLDVSKIEAGKLVLDEVDLSLRDVVDDVLAVVAVSARLKGLDLRSEVGADVPDTVVGDPGRLRQILLNLAGNAVKFTDQGTVRISVTVAPGACPSAAHSGRTSVRFAVTDTGIGLADVDRSSLFEPFRQADATTTRRFGGTGLGLAICRQLAEAMGGEVGVDSRLGAGSTFWCTVPFAGADHTHPSSRQSADRPLRVLVADLDGERRDELHARLERWGMTAETAPSSVLGVEELLRGAGTGRPYDAVILDEDVGGGALELARLVRAEPAVRALSLIVLTSGPALDDRVAAAHGVTASRRRPVTQSQLYDCLVQAAPPRGRAPAAPAAPQRQAAPSGVVGHVLLAEDNAVNRLVATGMLGQLGYTVDVAHNGAEALQMLSAGGYCAVLMDCQMPVMDGYVATAAIRAREGGGPRTPIIALTAGALSEDRDRCRESGMDDYVTKPMTCEELGSALSRWAVAPAP